MTGRLLPVVWLVAAGIALWTCSAPAQSVTGDLAAPESHRALDSIPADTLINDSLPPPRDEGVDTLVNYSADVIDFDVLRRVTVLSGNATITYKDMTLEAGQIEVDWDRQLLTAAALSDTGFLDTGRTMIDTIIQRGRPHFTQAGDDFFGEEIAYNMKTRYGRVRGGVTTYEDGFYYGEQFKRLSPDVISVQDGSFTTCDDDTPHYHFEAKRLKVMVGRRVVARPVILYMEDVPCLAAPYGIFPQQHGRTSGILIPTFGESASQGRFLRDLGYYWAISDYMDTQASIDYYERFGILGRGGWRYTKRYVLDGDARFDFNTQRQGSQHRRDYSIAAHHNHVLDRNTRLALSGAYASSRTYVQNVGSVQDQLNQQLQSNVTLGKSWDNSPWTMNVNVNYTQYLNLDTWNTTLPAISLSHRSGQLFPPPKAPHNIRGAAAPRETNPPWYRAFSWTYSVAARNELAMPKQLREEGLMLGLIGLDGRPRANLSLRGDDSTTVYQKDGLVHRGGLSANAKLFKYFNFNPRINAVSLWTRRAVRYLADGKQLDRADEYGAFHRTTFDVGGSMTTKLYGLAQNPLGMGASFRHVMTPSVGFTYRPDFSDEAWGYFETATLPDGRSHTYDRFPSSENISGAGGTSQGLSERFSFDVGHLFQMKTGDPELETEKKFDLLSWNMGTGADVKRDSLRWDNLGMSFRTSVPGTIIGPMQNVSLDVTTSHSFYEGAGSRRVRRFFWERDDAKWYAPLDLLSASMDVGFTLQAPSLGEWVGVSDRGAPSALDDTLAVVPEESATEPFNPADLRGQRSRPAEEMRLPATGAPSQLYQMPLSIAVNLRQNRDYVGHSTTSSMSARATFSLTPKWDINFDYTFDLDRKEVRNTNVFVTRDLHCWEATFSWSPLGYRPGYFLRIGLKSPQLRDVKIERHRGAGLGGYF
ncbi:MAG: putative LPS assembly protein LptD [bacterium]|nr:putative LPS assembly protein LptD [bacterium]